MCKYKWYHKYYQDERNYAKVVKKGVIEQVLF